ncbi:tetratricopeptide repeat protein 33 isoform X3 [Mobula hypostoma]|uniref:tetratricopeptide repeat protein 33 isoform X3 n=1 Tax=Mobula hypostoma TaxID=723540 RepID=UPI002FC2E6D6
MTSFGWKRKVGEKVSKAASQVFEEAAEDGGLVDADVDWLHAAKRRRETLLEDCAVKSKRLKDEGVFLSENGRYWEAIGRWDEAIQLTPDCAALYEMKAQVLMILNEVFQAVQAAETAVRLNPQWWEAWQTLGRAQLSLGERGTLRHLEIAPKDEPNLTSFSDLNLIENLWAELKKHVRARRPTNLTQLHQFCLEEWNEIPAMYCEKLVEGYPKRLTQVKQFKGNATKYSKVYVNF